MEKLKRNNIIYYKYSNNYNNNNNNNNRNNYKADSSTAPYWVESGKIFICYDTDYDSENEDYISNLWETRNVVLRHTG